MSNKPLRYSVALYLCTLLSGCDLSFLSAAKIDAQWHREQLLEGLLSHWLAVSPADNGYMMPTFARAWRPIPKPSTHLTLQTRNIYAFASGYEVSGDKRYLQAASQGADFLLSHYRDPVYGGFYAGVAPDGKAVSEAKETYGHAFALLALAQIYHVTKEARYRDAALDTWHVLRGKMRDRLGGFRRSAPRNFDMGETIKTQNPVMHLFEAMLALYEATGNEEALAGAKSVGDFVLHTLLKESGDGTAHIEEWYDENWRPLADDKGGYTDLGHQFEWAFLLSRASIQGFPEIYAKASQQVLDYAIKVGYDESNGGAFSRVSSTGNVDHGKGYWQQSECLRVLMHFMVARGKSNLRPRYEQTLQYVKDEWIDTGYGGWRMTPKSECTAAHCIDEQPDPYHMTAMHREALGLAASQEKGWFDDSHAAEAGR
jgi:mannose-6-phosphate isomerase